MKKPRVRVSKELAHQYAEDQKLTTAKRKKIVIPGPWTNLETELVLDVSLRIHQPVTKLEPYYGTYREDNNWNEKAWFPISINLVFSDMGNLVLKHGLDKCLAACEKSLNDQKRYGTLILLQVVSDNSQRTSDPFVSVKAKTNKKNILGFAATRSNELIVLTKANQSATIDLPAES
jgi:hypothetical protein